MEKKVKTKKKKKVSISSIILILLMVIGAVIMLYPTVSDWWNDMHMSKAIDSYVEQVESMDTNKKSQLIEEAREYNETLSTGVHFLSEERNPEEYAEYETVLDITGTGIMGYIQIPSISVNLPIYHGVSDAVLQVAVGHIPGTSIPVGGEGTHAVLSGHRGLPSAKLFTDLDQLAAGDIFLVNVLDETYTYQVDQIRTVLPEEISDMAIVDGKDYITLVTCTPYGVNSHRMLVRGHRIDNLPPEVREVLINSDAVRVPIPLVMLGLVIIQVLIAILISAIKTSINKKKKSSEKIYDELTKVSEKTGDSENEK